MYDFDENRNENGRRFKIQDYKNSSLFYKINFLIK